MATDTPAKPTPAAPAKSKRAAARRRPAAPKRPAAKRATPTLPTGRRVAADMVALRPCRTEAHPPFAGEQRLGHAAGRAGRARGRLVPARPS